MCHNVTYTTRQGSRVSCLDQTGFVAFGKEVELFSGSLPMLKSNNIRDQPQLPQVEKRAKLNSGDRGEDNDYP